MQFYVFSAVGVACLIVYILLKGISKKYDISISPAVLKLTGILTVLVICAGM